MFQVGCLTDVLKIKNFIDFQMILNNQNIHYYLYYLKVKKGMGNVR